MVGDIDSAQMVIRVEQGKGRKDRYVVLSQHLLDLLRAWWKAARPQGWLFPRRDPVQPLTTRQLNRACHAATQMAEIDKPVSLHTLRHSFATHLLEHFAPSSSARLDVRRRRIRAAISTTRVTPRTKPARASSTIPTRPTRSITSRGRTAGSRRVMKRPSMSGQPGEGSRRCPAHIDLSGPDSGLGVSAASRDGIPYANWTRVADVRGRRPIGWRPSSRDLMEATRLSPGLARATGRCSSVRSPRPLSAGC